MVKKTKKQLGRDEQLYQLTTVAAGAFSLHDVLGRLAEAAVKIAGVKACAIRLLDEQAGELKMRSTYGLSEEYRNKGEVSKNDTVIRAAFAGEAVVLDDVRVDARVKYREAAIKEGLVSQLTVAMTFRDKAIGILRLYSPKPKSFDSDDIAIARAVASQCAVAITNAKLYAEAIEGARIAEQMRLAGTIQRRMVPKKAPKIEGLDISATYIPCFDVGGDFYGFSLINDKQVAINIADVMGKGFPAALMMSSFRGSIRAYIDMIGRHVGEEGNYNRDFKYVIDRVNRMACRECRDGEFVTLFHAVIDVEQESLSYCNCGHEPAVLIRDGHASDLDKGGLVLGIDKDAKYESENIKLEDGDCVIFYTDGLIDAVNFDGEFWGREKMLETAKKFVDDSAEQMLKNILGYRRRFVGLASQIDDTSVIVVKYDSRAKDTQA